MGALVGMIIGSVMGTVGSILNGVGIKEKAEAQKSAYKRQAAIAKKSAYAESDRLRRLKKIKLRRMTEAVGKSGVRGDVGTPLDVIIDTSSQLEMDIINIERGGIYAYESSIAAARNAERAGKLAQFGAMIQSMGGDAQNFGSFDYGQLGGGAKAGGGQYAYKGGGGVALNGSGTNLSVNIA